MTKKMIWVAIVAVAVAGIWGSLGLRADEFTKEDLERWEKEYMSVVQKGRELWVSPTLGTNGVACAQCHPNGGRSWKSA